MESVGGKRNTHSATNSLGTNEAEWWTRREKEGHGEESARALAFLFLAEGYGESELKMLKIIL